ncbi:MAG TPA: class I SAM-dependent methyltransferase [Planctomycetota bacterium]|nr:class I SAM-dependent methyltransferase [Planctomycetota bacterium]
MIPFLVALSSLLLVVSVGIGWAYLRDWSRRKGRNPFSRFPIRSVPVWEVDPVFRPGPLGPTLATEARLLAGSDLIRVIGGTSDTEAWVLAVLAKDARTLFEFGTATGRTAYLWAVNAPDDARIGTLTLPPESVAAYVREAGDRDFDVRHALEESTFTRLYYDDTPAARKIQQLYGDSKTFDETPWLGACDLVFVDGSHARSYVESDSRKALRMVRPGGLVLWHDYRGRRLRGVYDALNALAREVPLVHVAGTSFVAYRAPRSPAGADAVTEAR